MNKLIKSGLIILLSSFIFSCEYIDNETRTYNDFKDYKIEIDDLYNVSENHYLVYLYREDCSHCNKIKGYIFDYIEENNFVVKDSKKINMYLMEFDTSSSELGHFQRDKFKENKGVSGYSDQEREEAIIEMKNNHVSTISETYLVGFPMVYEVLNGSFNNGWFGDDTIKNYLKG